MSPHWMKTGPLLTPQCSIFSFSSISFLLPEATLRGWILSLLSLGFHPVKNVSSLAKGEQQGNKCKDYVTIANKISLENINWARGLSQSLTLVSQRFVMVISLLGKASRTEERENKSWETQSTQ